MSNAPLFLTDPLGLKVRGNGEVDDKALNAFYSNYLGKDGNVLPSLPKDSDDRLRAIILKAMRDAPYVMVMKGASPCEHAANIELHIEARIRIVKRTETKQFLFGADSRNKPIYHYSAPGPFSSNEERYKSLNNSQTQMHCADAANWMLSASGAETKLTAFVELPSQAVPGDLVYIRNSAHQIYDSSLPRDEQLRDAPFKYTTEGENTVALGSNKFWGHINNNNTTYSFEEWCSIISGWRGTGGEVGVPKLESKVALPSTGIEHIENTVIVIIKVKK